MNKKRQKINKKNLCIIVIIFIIAILVIGFITIRSIHQNNKAVTFITLDINPSIKISLNKKEKVLKVEPLNDDAIKLLNDQKFKKDTLEKTLSQLSDLLVTKGYMQGENNILINIEGDNIENKVSSIIKETFNNKNVECNIIIQEITSNAYDNAKKYGITLSKASFIENIISNHEDVSFEDLKDKSVDDIKKYIYEKEQQKIEEERKKEEQRKKEEEKKKKEQEEQENKKGNQSSNNYVVSNNISEEFKKQQEELQRLMNQYTGEEEQIKELMRNLNVVALGDSVMLGAEYNLKKLFPNIYFDAALNRNGSHIRNILQSLSAAGTLGEPIVISAGSNGDCKESVKDTIMQLAGNREVFWITVTNDYNVHVNDKLKAYASKYPNLHIIDWEAISAGHSEYLYKDGVHLPPAGRTAYANAIYYEIYKVYTAKFDSLLEEKNNEQTKEPEKTPEQEPTQEQKQPTDTDKVEEKTEPQANKD